MAFEAKNFVLCSKFNLFKAHCNLWIYATSDTLEDCLVPNYFQPRRNVKNQDSPEVGDVIQLIVEGSKLAYLKITAKTEKPYNITVARTFLENEADIMADITALQLGKASKDGDFVTAITEENLGITQAEQTELEQKIDTAANSGRMITPQGFWYAKMYAGTTAPSADNGTNYADFSQVDGEGNPIIVTYNRTGGVWAQDQTITPPADYDGYVPITSKIWDIAEQDGQQGGRVLWNHTSKQFTPYPNIVSFDSIEITGDSTVEMPVNPTNDNIANVGFVKNTIGTARNIGDVFYTSRKDTALNGAVDCNGATYNTTDFSGAHSIGNLLALNKLPYVSLSVYQTLLNTQGSVGVFGWDGVGTTAFRVPNLTDIFVETGTAAQLGNYISPKIPNLKAIVPNALFYNDSQSDNGVVHFDSSTVLGLSSGGGNEVYRAFDIDASRESGVYDNTATTVQPNAVRYRAMIQLAVSSTDEALETCTSVLSDIAGLKDNSNLTSVGKNIANWSSNVSKCITEIPQDIKLELNNGTLTLKAGSKYYYPNGEGVFEIRTVPTDTTLTQGWGSSQTFLLFVRSDGSLGIYDTARCYSGTSSVSEGAYYNTNDNKVYVYNGGSLDYQASLPIAKITGQSPTITSIDQVFNGFGYIGSTRFALPGIKWLSPDNRNADGTLKSIQRTNTNVLVETLSSGTVNNIVMVLGTGSIWTSGKYIESETEPSGNYIIWYKPSENILRDKAEGSWNINNNVVVYGYYDAVSSQITSFRTKQPFHAMDYNDFKSVLDSSHIVIASQKPTADNNYTWFFKYSDGWVEQGGTYSPTSTINSDTVNLPVTMADTHYNIQVTIVDDTSSNAPTYASVGARTKGTSSFTVYGQASFVKDWVVRGFYA